MERQYKRIFTTAIDGFRLSGLYHRCGTQYPLLLLIKAVAGDRFGAYLTQALYARLRIHLAFLLMAHSRSERKPKEVFGDRETFVFGVIEGKLKAYHWSGIAGEAECLNALLNDQYVAASDGTESHFIYADDKGLMLGVGKGGAAIHFDDNLDHVTSIATKTFNNPAFLSDKAKHTIALVEVWVMKDA